MPIRVRMSRFFSIIIMVSEAMMLKAPMSPMKASTMKVKNFSEALVLVHQRVLLVARLHQEGFAQCSAEVLRRPRPGRCRGFSCSSKALTALS